MTVVEVIQVPSSFQFYLVVVCRQNCCHGLSLLRSKVVERLKKYEGNYSYLYSAKLF